MPWVFSGANILERFGEGTTITCDATGNVEADKAREVVVAKSGVYNNTCSIQTRNINAGIMPHLIQLPYMPPPTSSSLMRVFIASVLCGKRDDTEKIKKIMFGLSGIDDVLQTELVDDTLEEYSTIPSEYKKALQDYKILEDAYGVKGGRSTRKSTKPKSRRTSKKQRTHKKKISMKHKLRR
jgi:hypothetical protein